MRAFSLILVFLLYSSANFYVGCRICRLLRLLGLRGGAAAAAVTFALLSAAVLLSFLGNRPGLRGALFAVGSVWMGVLLYLFLFTAAAELFCLVFRLAGRLTDSVKRFAELAVLLLTAVTVIGGAIHARDVQTVRYVVDSGRSAEPLKIVLVSDLHLGALGVEGRLREIAEKISLEEPDVVCVAGDVFNNDFSAVRDPAAAAEALRGIHAKYGVYACLGNHDCGEGFDEMLRFLSDAGITLLREEGAAIPSRCVLFGRAEASPIGAAGEVKREAFVLEAAPEDAALPVIVLDHNPARVGEYGPDVSLVLCGHTHKGQLFPGALITRAVYDVDYGLRPASESAPAVVVTSGVGYWGPPLRVGTDSELAVIELR